ncbi:calcium/hydrogen antiporter Ecym_2021 [Eremothecium cymbalariae DBVPG|uniref:Sodium/calcium exchanger membrane region domain-containing protein n=1 Tax=Eremothecium cymbalariae (strain CBS 270.75 / DBVPG 7215 / KCTC 17166 / NRRL Y-17582) TaxID=931890 RepID=G8JNY0_ERECY|nr:Hypothetical protein Ecym_2021 [Eremothecium cymbalariae DBVPG\
MSKRLPNQSKNTHDSTRRVFSVDYDSNEFHNEPRYHRGCQDGMNVNKNHRGSTLNASATAPSLLGGVGCGSVGASIRPSLEQKHSRFSIDDDNDEIGVQDNHHDMVLPPTIEDQESITTVESYTLRERQEAINETHPFGIRIWKPALYKKQRSVQKAANEDIHETKYRHVSLSLHFSNVLWSLTLGLFMYLVLTLGGVLVISLGLWTESAQDYSRVFFKLGRYLLWPFGKVVYIVSDQHYLLEDKDEGISMHQFYKWISSTGNRLFFHQMGTNMQSPLTFQRDTTYDSIIRDINTESDEAQDLATDSVPQRRLFGRGQWSVGRIAFYALFHVVIQPTMMFLVAITWLAVFTIPMSNIMWNLMYHCRRHPLALEFKHVKNSDLPTTADQEMETKNVLLCTFRCAGLHYYKFTVDGTNIIVMNLIAIVFFTIFNFYMIKGYFGATIWLTQDSVIFLFCLLSIIPLAFYIGQAVASISAQTSMGVGAVLNAFFTTVVEVFLYCIALIQSKGLLVEGSLIGSLLGAVLLLPGLSMCGGALKRKTQRYNPASAGVSSAMLIFSMMVMFVPTILYGIYGEWDMICKQTPNLLTKSCNFIQPPLKFDNMYLKVIKPISIICAVVLFLAYIIGLWFTLRTHAAMIWQMPITDQRQQQSQPLQQQQQQQQQQNQHQHQAQSVGRREQYSNAAGISFNSVGPPLYEQKGHSGPNWSRTKSTYILLGASILYAVIAEILVSCVDGVLTKIPSVSPKFLGLTIFALVPNTTEFLNAISFAINGNVALSMEIGSAYALQVCLLQIPALVIYSLIYTMNMDESQINIRDQMFALVFPRWDLIACVISGFLFTYLYAEGKSNYFKGSILILLYIVTIVGFYFQDLMDEYLKI